MTHLIHNKYKVGNIVVAEAIIRPTGLLDPVIEIKPVKNQVDSVLEEVRQRIAKNQRVLITTLTKKFAEELDFYFKEINIKSAYIHSDVETLDRLDILSDLRSGKYDVLIGINLLREGLDLPEVSLVAIFDADKEGFLRSRTSLIQIVGRAARHSEGKVIMYADKITKSMQSAIDETNRRRKIQMEYNQKYNIIPTTVIREKYDLVKEIKTKKDDSNKAILTPFGFEKLDELISLGSQKRKDDKNYKKSKKQEQIKKIDFKNESKKGKQIFDNFDKLKKEYMQEILAKKYSIEELTQLLSQSVKDMEFEKSAAIRDILNSN